VCDYRQVCVAVAIAIATAISFGFVFCRAPKELVCFFLPAPQLRHVFVVVPLAEDRKQKTED